MTCLALPNTLRYTAEQVADLRRRYRYDPDTGLLFSRRFKNRKKPVGRKDRDGYLRVHVKGRELRAHRVAWMIHYGRAPRYTIDHINGNRTDNRISNLRDIPASLNSGIRHGKPNPVTGLVGVCHWSDGKGQWYYRTQVDKKSYYFKTAAEAAAFRRAHGRAA